MHIQVTLIPVNFWLKLEQQPYRVNIVGLHGVRSPKNRSAQAPIRYDAVREGLSQVADFALSTSASVHMPRIGCGLAGGTWEEIEPIIKECLTSKGIEVFVYDL